MTDFTVIIPHRGAALGLWATIHSCEEELTGSSHSYNYVVVSNGEKINQDTRNCLEALKKSGKLLEHRHYDEPLAPPTARQRGAECANGRLLFFFDNHCLVAKQYFDRAVAALDSDAVDMLHSATRFYLDGDTHYHYHLKLDYNFWAESTLLPEKEYKPYKIAAGGHGGFAIKRTVWDEVGGYGPDRLLVGYGGEELMFDLRLWRMGKNVWLDPRMVHYHFAGDRGYSRHYTDEYYTNMMVSALVTGGEKWLYKVYESFATKKHLRVTSSKTMYDLLEEAHDRSWKYAAEVDAKSVRSLDETLTWFKRQQVAM